MSASLVTPALAMVSKSGGKSALGMPSLGNLDAYISAANRLPMLSLEQEQTLAKKFRDEEDLDAARELVLSHLRLVVSVARQYLGYGLPHGDLIQEGNIGLMKAVKRFDADRGVRLVSFAIHWIKAEIHEYILRNWRMVKVATTKAQRKLFFNLRSHKVDGHTLPPDVVARIARDLNVKESEVVEMETRLGGGDHSLEGTSDDSDDNSFAPVAYLVSPHSEPLQVIEARESDWLQSEGIAKALDTLDERSKAIVKARWLIDDDESAKTLHDLAAEYGVSAERIRQIEAKAMKTMKTALAAYR